MPLVSQLFSANRRLQACLIDNSAHVLHGSKGEHVELIQAALIRLRFLEPGDGLAEAGEYGTRTADAVLRYKQMFDIVNRTYQRTADDIVGRMTIASLDAHMAVFDSVRNVPPVPLHEFPDRVLIGPVSSNPRQMVAFATTGAVTAGLPVRGAFTPPLSELPADMQEVVWRSNLAKIEGTPSMYPFVSNHEGPLDSDELCRRFAKFNGERGLMLELYNRMRPFAIWRLINTIRGVVWGEGSRGMFCHPHDHARAYAHMQALSTGPTHHPNPNLSDITRAFSVTDSPFCKDALNVHGERDSWREIVSGGPGLHICVTNATGRALSNENYPASDFHIDEIQQGQFCSNGTCIPLINGQTIGHLKTVGPWLAKRPGEWLRKHLPW
ncbi:hypothetical protein [Arvimicrobium flavum]|uniref:hypothetical protein n=1 Tax=Arvimicrobium flavum TaxID=3393320 RepID=UPI00237A6A71|nr:hypothetical protein [Mesorhizobium shangrilense]